MSDNPKSKIENPKCNARQQAALECCEIARRLYEADKETYADIYSWINKHLKRNTEMPMMLEALRILEKHDGWGQKPHQLHQYMDGVLRSLQNEKEAAELRASRGPSVLGDILDRAQARSREKDG